MVNSISGNAALGIQRGLTGIRKVASEIAGVPQNRAVSQPSDLTRSLVELKQHAHQTKASIKALKTADQVLGTLLDIRA